MIRTPAPDVLTDACAEARERYRRTRPAPRPTDFPCTWCRAPVGRPCTVRVPGRRGPHRPRGDAYRRAHDAWAAGAESACDAAVNVLHDLARILDADPFTGGRS